MGFVIQIKNLSKQYQLGIVSTRTLSHDIHRWWATTFLGRNDPYLSIEQLILADKESKPEYILALRDINLEVKEGEVLGIIGKNGAGKSTLLKLISKITSPTTGTIKVRGRIASLLEIGTGFHPEMTGRENIFLNGAIMGMTKMEISRKFDEIVDFSGVAQFIDTPVKRYSSGMTVRLGFAIAAHLEPEILVIDEVLAVGDAEFQKKAVGKMKDVSNQKSRTVLFVSHNLGAIRDLCQNTIILDKGRISGQGESQLMIEKYLENSLNLSHVYSKHNISVKEISFSPQTAYSNSPIQYSLKIHTTQEELVNSIGFLIYNNTGQRIAIVDLRDPNINYRLKANQELHFTGQLNNLPLIEGIYNIGLFYWGNFIHENIHDLFSLQIINDNSTLIKYPLEVRGYVDLRNHFSYEIN